MFTVNQQSIKKYYSVLINFFAVNNVYREYSCIKYSYNEYG